MAEIGHNQPPGMIETVASTMSDISNWMSENPVVTEETAKDAKLFLDRGKLAIKDLEDERDAKVRPLNEQVKATNAIYKPPREILSRVLDALSGRLSAFIKEETRRKEAIAQEAARLVAEAESAARESENREREAIEAAGHGELGVDVATHVAEADATFSAFEKAQRAAAVAQRETHVKVGGGFSRAISLKEKETVTVTDAIAAIAEMGASEGVKEAIIKSARAYRRATGDLPNGVTSQITEGI